MAREVVGNNSEQSGENASSEHHSAWDSLAEDVPFAGGHDVNMPVAMEGAETPDEPETPDKPETPDEPEIPAFDFDAWKDEETKEDIDLAGTTEIADTDAMAFSTPEMVDVNGDSSVGEVEPQPQLHEFGAFRLSDDELGASKVAVSKVKRRPFFDIKGRKADKDELDLLFSYYGTMDSSVDSRLTPSVAGELVHVLESGKDSELEGIHSSALVQLFEKLPLDDQQRIAKSKNGAKLLAIMSREGGIYDRSADGAILKIAAGLTARFGEHAPNQKERAILQDFGKVGPSTYVAREKSLFFNNTERANRSAFFGALTRCGVKKFDAALTVLDEESILDRVEELTDGQEDTLTIGHAVVLQQRAWDATGEAKTKCFDAYSKVFGGKSMDALKTMLESNFSSQFRNRSEIFAINDETADGMLSIIHQAMGVGQELGIGANRLAEVVAIEGGGPILQKITEAWPIEDETRKKNIKQYLLEKEHIDQEYGIGVEDLETFDNMRGLYLKGARARLERGDYAGARKNICEYAYGVRFGTVMRNLVAMGVVSVDESGVRSAGKIEEYYEGGGSTGEKVQVGNLKRLREVGKLSAAEEALVLDAIALARMPGKKLGDRLDLYEAGSGSVDLGLGDLLMKTREKYSRVMTREIEAQSQEGLQGARLIDEIECADPKDSSKTVKVPVMKMESDRFILAVHKLGAFYSGGKDLDVPENWNTRNPTKFRPDGHPAGYISTSMISEKILGVTSIDEDDPDEIFYAFAELGDGPVAQFAAEYDLYTEPEEVGQGSNEYVINSSMQDFFYEDPREVPDRVLKRHGSYSEVVLDRYGGDPNVHDGRLQPSHLVVFAGDESSIGERVKKHAAYFGVPILLIDPKKYGRRKK